MPVIKCPDCDKSLKVSDNTIGKRVSCPGCKNPFVVPDVSVVELVEVVEEDEEERVTTRPNQRPQSRRPREDEDDDEPRRRRRPRDEEDDGVARAAKKPKRKKQRIAQERSDHLFPTWMLWLVSLGVPFVLAGIVALTALHLGHGDEVLLYTVILAVLLPVSTIILILSMFISSWLGGGIEFGEAHIVIPKAFGLLLIVNLIGLLPFGTFLAFPVWLCGLMILFHLELWETRILVLVNWGLNFLARMVVLSAIMTNMSHEGLQPTPIDRPGRKAAISVEDKSFSHRPETL